MVENEENVCSCLVCNNIGCAIIGFNVLNMLLQRVLCMLTDGFVTNKTFSNVAFL